MAFASRNFEIIDSDDDELDHEVCFGEYRGEIVGIRYYNGTVNRGEMVSLNREPHNPYDKNAIRVDNVFGIQVGHIKRTLALPLASIIDRGLVRLEGTVPYGQNNVFSMPCDLEFWGRPENQEQVVQKIRQHGFILRTYTGNNKSAAPSKGDYDNYSIPTSIKISQDQMHNELNKLFDKMEEMDKGDKTPVDVEPAEAIKTKLYPHQKQSLAWMIAKENNKDLPPFWEERTRNGKKEFFNTATNYATTTRPSCVKGGILADDMGLGKTLQIISLILTNFHDGKPLATLEDAGTGTNKTLKQKVRRPTKHSSKKKSAGKKKVKKAVLVESSEEEEMSEDNDDDEAIEPDNSNKVMIGKTDPDFKPVAEVNVEPEKTGLRRSARSRKKPVKYVEVDSDVDEKTENVAPSPKKKPRKKQPSTEPVKIAEAPVGEEQLSDCQIVSPPLPSFPKDNISDAKDTSSLPVGTISTCTTTKASSNQGSSKANVGSTARKQRKAVPHGARRPTLVVSPLSVLSSWENELETHVHPNLINVYTHYGQNRTKDKKVLEEQDIVLTTYQTLSADFSRGKSPLKEVKWLRVILDEGHLIRNPRAQMTKAAHALDAERRWIVTGTPIQNSMKDLWSIICFLRMEPFLDRQWWVRSIERPISQGDKAALGRIRSMMRIVAMRRTKTQKVNGKPLVELPDRQLFIQPVELSLEERKLYDSMAKEGKLVIGNYVQSEALFQNYADVLAILMRLRQLCCHPRLCASALALLSESSKSGTPEELRQRLIASLMAVLATGVDEECPVCLDSLVNPVITHCAHVFCRPCIENVIKTTDHQRSRCPLCRGDIKNNQLVEVPNEVEDGGPADGEKWQSSSKVDCLMAKLVELRNTDPSIKSVVISQFTSLLSLIEVPLKDQQFSYVRLDGSMSQARRAEVIDTFNKSDPDSPTVFLLSLKAGGVGLNLTAACRVFLLDPAWNPAAEEQCFDRCHRLGQTRDVIITKFVVKDSVEERMLDLQKKKRELMTEAFKKKTSAEDRRKQRINEIKALIDL